MSAIFDQRELRHYNRVQAWLSLAIFDIREARRYFRRNKQIHRFERAKERVDCVN